MADVIDGPLPEAIGGVRIVVISGGLEKVCIFHPPVGAHFAFGFQAGQDVGELEGVPG